MPDLMDTAIEEATQSPHAAELMRASRRYDELRQSTAWTELREEVKARREIVIRVLGEKALKGADPQRLHDEGLYSKGFLAGCEALLDRPDEVEQKLEKLIEASYENLRNAAAEATLDDSPYG
jgi:hypothetical protein